MSEENIGKTFSDINHSRILYDPPPRILEIIANEATDKELISKIYKQLMQLNTRKIEDPIKKWAKELNRHLSKEDIQMADKQEKRCSILSEQSKSKPQ